MRKALDAQGFTLLELLVVVTIIGVLAAFSMTQVMRARLASNEVAAIASMRSINTAQQGYAQMCHGYATNLPELITAGSFLSPDLASGAVVLKSGYVITLLAAAGSFPVPVQLGCTGSASNYYATATPGLVGTSGRRAFATTGQGTIFYDVTGVPPPDPIPAGALPIQ